MSILILQQQQLQLQQQFDVISLIVLQNQEIQSLKFIQLYNMNQRRLQLINFQKKQISRSFALQDFSTQLDNQLNILKSQKNSHLKQHYLKQPKNNNDINLPYLNIKSSNREKEKSVKSTKLNEKAKEKQSIKQKKYLLQKVQKNGRNFISQYQYLNKAKQLQTKLKQLEQNNCNFTKFDRLMEASQSQSDNDEEYQNVRPRIFNRPIILQSPPPQIIPIPIYNYPPKDYSIMEDQQNQNYYHSYSAYSSPNQTKTRYNKNKKKASSNISQSRKSYLKRKLKIISLAVYFIPLFKTYCKSIILKKCNRYLQIQKVIITEPGTIQWKMFGLLFNFDIFFVFYSVFQNVQRNKDKQNQNQKQKQKQSQNVQLLYLKEKITVNIKACHQFIKVMLVNMQKAISQCAITALYPYLLSMIDGNFPLSSFFLQQQFKFLNLHPTHGYLRLKSQASKVLLVNFLFIQIFVYRMLKKIPQIIKITLSTKRKKLQQKKLPTYQKKLTITLALFYQTVNSIFITQYNKSKSNYQQMPQKLKIQPHNQLYYQFEGIKQKQKQNTKTAIVTNQKDLIKGIKCSQSLKISFINGFQENWNLIKKIIQDLYRKVTQYSFQNLGKIKEEVREQKFPKRLQLDSIVDYKYSKIKNMEESKNKKNSNK